MRFLSASLPGHFVQQYLLARSLNTHRPQNSPGSIRILPCDGAGAFSRSLQRNRRASFVSLSFAHIVARFQPVRSIYTTVTQVLEGDNGQPPAMRHPHQTAEIIHGAKLGINAVIVSLVET